MKKGYWIVSYRSVSDEARLQAYNKIAGQAVQASGGRPLVLPSGTSELKEAGLKEPTVVIEFESFEKALATYHSDAYKVALDTLGSAAERDFRIFEGV